MFFIYLVWLTYISSHFLKASLPDFSPILTNKSHFARHQTSFINFLLCSIFTSASQLKRKLFSDELCASEIYQGFQSIANTYDWFPFASSFPSETVTSLQLQSFVFVPSYFQSILFSTSISVDFQSTVSFKQNDKKTCFDCVILLVFFFSSFSTNMAQKSVYISFSHVYFSIDAFNWQHFIWEKRKQKHRLSMAQKKTTRYTQWVPYRRFYTIWFVKKSLTTSKHCCIHITVYDVSPLLSLDCSGTTTKAFLIQCCVYLICSSVSFVIQNLCRLFFIIFYRNSYIIRCDVIPFLFNIPFSSLCTTKENTPNHLCCCCTSISVEYDFRINNQGCNLYASTFFSFACFFFLFFFLFFLSFLFYKCLSLRLTLHSTLFAF